MKSVVVSALLIAVAGAAFAGPSCNAPKKKWMPKAGKKVEIYFDPVSGKPVEQK